VGSNFNIMASVPELSQTDWGGFGDNEGEDYDPSTNSIDIEKDNLIYITAKSSDEGQTDAEKKKQRRALCWSIAAMALSIPALIGA